MAARNTTKEMAWANAKYGPRITGRLESPEQHAAFTAWLKESGISYAAWLQGKVREELEKRGGR